MADNRIVVVDENGEEVKETFKEKLKKFTEAAKEKCGDAAKWAKDNPAQASAAVSGIIGGCYGLKKLMAPKKTGAEIDEMKRRLTYYDARTHIWWPLRRELTVSEKFRIEAAINNGESVGEVLQDLGVLAH